MRDDATRPAEIYINTLAFVTKARCTLWSQKHVCDNTRLVSMTIEFVYDCRVRE